MILRGLIQFLAIKFWRRSMSAYDALETPPVYELDFACMRGIERCPACADTLLTLGNLANLPSEDGPLSTSIYP
jgi:hypothetical protein